MMSSLDDDSDVPSTDQLHRRDFLKRFGIPIGAVGAVGIIAAMLTAVAVLTPKTKRDYPNILNPHQFPDPLPSLYAELDRALWDFSPNTLVDQVQHYLVVTKLTEAIDMRENPKWQKVHYLYKLIEAETVLGITEGTFEESERSRLIKHNEAMLAYANDAIANDVTRGEMHSMAGRAYQSSKEVGFLYSVIVPPYTNYKRAAEVPPKGQRSIDDDTFVSDMQKQRAEAIEAIKKLKDLNVDSSDIEPLSPHRQSDGPQR